MFMYCKRDLSMQPRSIHTSAHGTLSIRTACVFLHVERGRSSKQVWRSLRIIYSKRLLRFCHYRVAPCECMLSHRTKFTPASLTLSAAASLPVLLHTTWQLGLSFCPGGVNSSYAQNHTRFRIVVRLHPRLVSPSACMHRL
jgi:hypothetical protein